VKNLNLLFAVAVILISGCQTKNQENMNPFLTEYNTPFGVPPFDIIENEHFLPAFKEGISEQEAEINAIIANTEAPTFENTIAAFELAVQHGADAVELDAKLTSDDHVVVFHDQTLDRTTDGMGKVNEISFADLRKLDAGYSYAVQFKGEKIPTLDEVFESVGKRIIVNVELTNYKSLQDGLVVEVARIVKRHQMENRVLFSSFYPGNLVKIRKLLPETPVGLLCFPGMMGLLARSFLFRDISPGIIHPYLKDVNTSLVEREKRNRRRVHVWTVNDETDIRRMLELKVDGIFTDDPRKVLKLLGR